MNKQIVRAKYLVGGTVWYRTPEVFQEGEDTFAESDSRFIVAGDNWDAEQMFVAEVRREAAYFDREIVDMSIDSVEFVETVLVDAPKPKPKPLGTGDAVSFEIDGRWIIGKILGVYDGGFKVTEAVPQHLYRVGAESVKAA